MTKLIKQDKKKKTKEDIWEIIVFGWIMQGFPKECSELHKAQEARLLLKRLKNEWKLARKE